MREHGNGVATGASAAKMLMAAAKSLKNILRLATLPDLTGLFWTKQCENMSLERSLGYAEEAV